MSSKIDNPISYDSFNPSSNVIRQDFSGKIFLFVFKTLFTSSTETNLYPFALINSNCFLKNEGVIGWIPVCGILSLI